MNILFTTNTIVKWRYLLLFTNNSIVKCEDIVTLMTNSKHHLYQAKMQQLQPACLVVLYTAVRAGRRNIMDIVWHLRCREVIIIKNGLDLGQLYMLVVVSASGWLSSTVMNSAFILLHNTPYTSPAQLEDCRISKTIQQYTNSSNGIMHFSHGIN